MQLLKYSHVPVRTKSDRTFVDKHGPDAYQTAKGQRVVSFQETYMRPTRGFGANKSVKLLAWQRDELIMPLFSWVYPETGYRRYSNAFLGIPRQNGKSFITSSIALYMLMADNEPGSSVVVAATKLEQTEVILRECRAAIDQNQKLRKACRATKKLIEYPAGNGRLYGISSEKWGALGDPPHCFIADEFAFWESYEPWTAIETGAGSRRQPLYMAITTAGTDRSTVCYDQWRYAEAIQAGLIDDPSFFPLIYAAKDEDDIHDEKTWRKCNPSLGEFLDPAKVKEKSDRAKHSKIAELDFKQFRLNFWVSSQNVFLDLDAWQECTTKDWPTFPKDTTAFIGVDIGTLQDLSSVVTLIPYQGKWYVEHRSFCPIKTARKQNNAQKYQIFESEGVLEVHPGSCVELDRVREYIKAQCQTYWVSKIGIDTAKNAADTVIMLTNEGYPVESFICSAVSENTPMRRLSDLVLEGKLQHKGDSLINWQAQNLECQTGVRDLYKSKKPNEDAKIDTMVALIIAISQAITGEAEAAGVGTGIEFW